MNRIRCGAALLAAALMTLSGCGGGDDDSSSPTTKAETSTTARPASDVPPLPSPLPPVRDPGTVDPVLGDFPVGESRAVQFAWVSFAPDGREFTVQLRGLGDFFRGYSESDLYVDGIILCTELRQNRAVDATIEDRGRTYQTAENPITDEEVGQIGAAIALTAVEVLCPDMQVLVDDPDFQVPTPIAIRSILGIAAKALSDDGANKFANYICQQLDRGTTRSRLVSDIADEFDYPDDLSEELIGYIEGQVC